MKFIDIHSHVLFGIDDGSATLAQSLKMIQMAIDNGTTDLFVTPHYSIYDNINTPDITIPLFEKLKEVSAHLPIKLYLGNEMRVNSFCHKAIQSGHFNTLNNTNFVLIDYPFKSWINDPLELLLQIQTQPYTFIVAHPERHEYTSSIAFIQQLKDKGHKVQVNASSICGVHGETAQTTAIKLLKAEVVDFIGSDAHDLTYRKPILSDAYEIASQYCNQEYLKDIFYNNAYHYLIKKDM